MSLMNLTSGKSLWRGYKYYTENRVCYKTKTGPGEFEGRVTGSGKTYTVNIDTAHPRKSKCNCPHANGRRVICKHMIALYFAVFPAEAAKYYNEVMAYEAEEERRHEELDNMIYTYINKLSKAELKDLVLELLYDSTEWQFERFVRENIDL